MSDRESDSYRDMMSLEEAPPIRRIGVSLLCEQDSEPRIQLRISLTGEEFCRAYEGQSDPGQETILAIRSALSGKSVFSSQPFDQVELIVPPMIKCNLIVLLTITTGREVHYHQYCCIVKVSRERPLTRKEVIHALHQFRLQEARQVDQVICHSHGEVDSNTEGCKCTACVCKCIHLYPV